MAKKKKIGELPSGSIRTRVYLGKEPIFDEQGKPVIDAKTGKQKTKRKYASITGERKDDVKLEALKYKQQKEKLKTTDMTLQEAIKKYIDNSDSVLSPSTISGYNNILKNAFSNIMDQKISKLTNDILRDAVNRESKRTSTSTRALGKTISPKTVANEYGLVASVLNLYRPSLDCSVKLPQKEKRFNEICTPEEIFASVTGSDIELPVLLAMWLSFSMSEIRGLTKSKSLIGDCIAINEVIIRVNGKDVRKTQGKQVTRNRKHRLPPYIKQLIDQVDGDVIVPMNSHTIYEKFVRCLKTHNLPHMTFHDLRHVNASVMAMLRIPDKYAMERGGWKTDKIMKDTYMQTFSDQRVEVDNIIDDYFEKSLLKIKEKENNELFDKKKYTSWLCLFEKDDNEESKQEFLAFIKEKCTTKCTTK